MDSSQAFWNRIATRYAAQPIADEAAYAEKLARTRRRLRPDMALLEFGCGTGGTALIHAPHVGSILAIDSSENMIAIARARAEEAGIANVHFETGSIESLKAEDESFDMILAMSILHLVPDRHAVIAKVNRLLRPGGLFVSSTACLDTMPMILRLILPLAAGLRLAPQVHVFGDDDLVRGIQAGGFVVQDRWQPNREDAVFLIARKP